MVSGQRAAVRGQAVVSEERAEVSGQRAAVRGQAVVSEERAEVSGQRAAVRGQAVVSGQQSESSGQRSAVSGQQSTADLLPARWPSPRRSAGDPLAIRWRSAGGRPLADPGEQRVEGRGVLGEKLSDR